MRSTAAAVPGAIGEWRQSIASHVATDGGVIRAPVLDELAYRFILAWLREDGAANPLTKYRTEPQITMRDAPRLTATWRAGDSLVLKLWSTDQAVITRAQAHMTKPGVGPRDAFHAAHALAGGCDLITSADPRVSEVPGLSCLAP